MARSVSSWLSGPEPAVDSVDNTYPGQALGLPQTGPRSLARTGRRLAALCVDWLMCYGVAALLMSLGLISRPCSQRRCWRLWFVVGAVSVRLYGFSPGQLALGLQVVPSTADCVGFGRALVRGVLLAFVIPALFMDADGRGLHDRLSFTAVVRR